MLTKLSLGLVPPSEIRVDEVLCYWERLDEKMPGNHYALYRSPNRSLKAWILETPPTIAILYCLHTGQIHQLDPAALYPFKTRLGEWP